MGAGGRQSLTFLAYRSASVVARRVPPALGPAELAGVVCALTMRRRRAMVARHLRRVGGTGLSRAALALAVNRAFVSYARYWRDSFRLPELSPRELDAHMSSDGFHHLDAALRQGRGVILALPHLGSWDYGGAWLAAIGHPMTVVVEPLVGDELFAWLMGLRRSVGLSAVPLGPRAVPTVTAALRAGGVVGLVSDRDLAGRGVPVAFFGEETRLPAGPATLALRTGAALLPAAVLDEPGGRHLALVRPPIDTARRGHLAEDIARITQDLAGAMEGVIRRAPEQWHLFQPNWPSDPGYRAPRSAQRSGDSSLV